MTMSGQIENLAMSLELTEYRIVDSIARKSYCNEMKCSKESLVQKLNDNFILPLNSQHPFKIKNSKGSNRFCLISIWILKDQCTFTYTFAHHPSYNHIAVRVLRLATLSLATYKKLAVRELL
jgi:hypothetical protein